MAMFGRRLLLLAGAVGALQMQVLPPQQPSRQLPHIWTSTGFSPEARLADWSWPLTLTQNERTGLAMIGSLRGGTFTHVRIHWLLDFITARSIPDDHRHVIFDFSALDATLALLRRYALRPGFEIMGNPSGLVGDPIDKTQRRRLRALLLELTQRYSSRYGAHELKHWRWETWNEPDLHQYWNASLPSYLAYYHATVDALRDAGLHVGGPAGLFHEQHVFCWALLEEAARNALSPLAFVSFHHKGNSSADKVVEGTREIINTLRTRFPTLAKLPIVNDEADPLSGWWRDLEWRGDVRYGAMVARTALHLMDDVAFLSNDNAFLPQSPHFFSQRTLVACFPDAQNAHFFLKPVALTLALMSLLGDQRLPLAYNTTDNRLSAVAGAWTRSDGVYEAATLLSFGDDAREDITQRLNVDLDLHCDTGCQDARVAIFILDNVRTNPAMEWRKAGSPLVPDAMIRQKMREAQGPFRAVTSAPLTPQIQLGLRLPSVALVQVCGRSDKGPGAPNDLHAIRTASGEALLLWSDRRVGTRCLIGYELQGRRSADERWLTRTQGSILTQWHDANVTFEYRVRAVDLWNRQGPFSNICRL